MSLFVGGPVLLTLAGCSADSGIVDPPPPEPIVLSELAYVGSQACQSCQQQELNKWKISGHPGKLIKIRDGQPPQLPFGAAPLPVGYTWNDLTSVIGGFGWKPR